MEGTGRKVNDNNRAKQAKPQEGQKQGNSHKQNRPEQGNNAKKQAQPARNGNKNQQSGSSGQNHQNNRGQDNKKNAGQQNAKSSGNQNNRQNGNQQNKQNQQNNGGKRTKFFGRSSQNGDEGRMPAAATIRKISATRITITPTAKTTDLTHFYLTC